MQPSNGGMSAFEDQKPSVEGGGAGASAQKSRKHSQRPSLACSECTRRKTKCDKVIPCGQCVKRGKSHLCQQEPVPKLNGRRDSTSQGSDGPALSVPPRTAVFSELLAVQQTCDALRSRIASLEGALATALPPQPQQPTLSDASAVGGYYQQPYAGEAQTPGYYDPRIAYAEQQQQQQQNGYQAQAQYGQQGTLQQDVKEGSSTAGPSRTASEGQNGVSRSGSADGKQAEEELEASVALEFLALGRTRTFGVTAETEAAHDPDATASQQQRMDDSTTSPAHDASGAHTAGDPLAPNAASAAFVPNPTQQFPTSASLALAIPPRELTDALLRHSLEWMGWHHGCVCAPIFNHEVGEFWGWGEQRIDVCNPAWLSLFFAMLVVGIGNLAPGQAAAWQIEDQAGLARKWFDASMACLYRANFLQNHTVFATQAIAILVTSGQDAAGPNLIPTLLSTGISIAFDLGMHRMGSDQEWQSQVAGAPQEVRVRSLVARETRKRTFWALTTQDWFGVAFRKVYSVQPTQVTTPLPSNAHDSDLLTGQLVNRPPAEYTVVSKLLLWIQIARCLQESFEHLEKNPSPSYEFLLKVDTKLGAILEHAPAFFNDDGPTVNMPPCVDWLRCTFRVSANHKVLTLHRPYLHRSFQDRNFQVSRRRAIDASRAILREAPRVGSSRLWTSCYHLTVGAVVVLLDLFQRSGSSSPTLDEERREVQTALKVLREMEDSSSVARRGVALIENLLVEEQRLREERAAQGGGTTWMRGGQQERRANKRGLSSASGDGDFSRAAKKVVSNSSAGSPSGAASAAGSATSGTTPTSESPAAYSTINTTPSSQAPPSSLQPFHPSHAEMPPPPSAASAAGGTNELSPSNVYGSLLADGAPDPAISAFDSIFEQSGLDLGLGFNEYAYGQGAFGGGVSGTVDSPGAFGDAMLGAGYDGVGVDSHYLPLGGVAYGGMVYGR